MVYKKSNKLIKIILSILLLFTLLLFSGTMANVNSQEGDLGTELVNTGDVSPESTYTEAGIEGEVGNTDEWGVETTTYTGSLVYQQTTVGEYTYIDENGETITSTVSVTGYLEGYYQANNGRYYPVGSVVTDLIDHGDDSTPDVTATWEYQQTHPCQNVRPECTSAVTSPNNFILGVGESINVDTQFTSICWQSGFVRPVPQISEGEYEMVVTASGVSGLNYYRPYHTYTITGVSPGTVYMIMQNNLETTGGYPRSCWTHLYFDVQEINPDPWWQVKDADVFSNGSLITGVPSSNVFNLEGDGEYPGIPVYGGSSDLTSSNVSLKGWIANSTYKWNKIYDYSYFSRLVPTSVVFNDLASDTIEGSQLESGTEDSSGYSWYMFDGESTGFDLTINSNVSLGSRKAILFVKGADLHINGDINLTKGSGFFMAIVGKNDSGGKGNIMVNPAVGGGSEINPNLEGLYMADGTFSAGEASTPLYVRGSVAAWGGISLPRDLGDDLNGDNPSEFFEYAPDLVLNYPKALTDYIMRWKEVAP
ncbi:hypothetical protein ACFL1Q_00255 [Patescibacteria group bacterium]